MPLTGRDLDRAMTDLGPMGLDIVNAALEHLTRWMTRLYSTLGDHLVYDSMPIASFSTVVESRERDGGGLMTSGT